MIQRIGGVAHQLGFECEEIHEELYHLREASRRFTMLNTPGKIVQLSWLARRKIASADLIVSHGIHGALLPAKRRVHVLHSTHSGTAEAMKRHVPRLDFLVARYLWGGLFERLSLRAELCVAVSDSVARQAQRFYGRRCKVVPNSIHSAFQKLPAEKASLRQTLGIPSDKTILLNVGRRERLKGWRLMESILDLLPEEALVISVGAGESRQHPKLMLRAPLPHEALVAYYNAADWVIAPSLYEGFGLTILEAWACGTPVVASPTGVALELSGMEPAFDQCVAARTDCADALWEALGTALRAEGLGRAQVAWGQKILAERYSGAAFEQGWAEVLRALQAERTHN